MCLIYVHTVKKSQIHDSNPVLSNCKPRFSIRPCYKLVPSQMFYMSDFNQANKLRWELRYKYTKVPIGNLVKYKPASPQDCLARKARTKNERSWGSWQGKNDRKILKVNSGIGEVFPNGFRDQGCNGLECSIKEITAKKTR